MHDSPSAYASRKVGHVLFILIAYLDATRAAHSLRVLYAEAAGAPIGIAGAYIG